MKIPGLTRLFSILLLVAGVVSCVSSSMVMESVADPNYSKPLQRVVIVSNGELFPEATKNILFLPSVDVVQRLLSQHGVASSIVQTRKNELNPSFELPGAARELNATHVLYFTVSKVTGVGPARLPESDPRSQHRLISDYTYSLIITDLQTRKNVWKGEVRGGSGIPTEDSLRQIEEKLKEHLYKARLLTPPQ